MDITKAPYNQCHWGVNLGIDQASGFSETSVVLNSIRQYERDQVAENIQADSIRSLFEGGVVHLHKKITDARKQNGETSLTLNNDELLIVAKSLIHYSSRTADELKFNTGPQGLEMAHTRIVEAGVAGYMIDKIIGATSEDDKVKNLIKPNNSHYGFSRALNPKSIT